MMLDVCYVVTAFVLAEAGRELRQYFGICKVYANQSVKSALASRRKRHLARPVRWLAALDPTTFVLKQCGHEMTLENALAEEAILTACALQSKGAKSRGGPWAHQKIRKASRLEAKRVHAIWRKAATGAKARELVHEYAAQLPADSYLRLHLANESFNKDTAAPQMGPPSCRKRVSGKSESGHAKRVRAGWAYDDPRHKQHKWGGDVVGNRRSNNERYGTRGGEKTSTIIVHIIIIHYHHPSSIKPLA